MSDFRTKLLGLAALATAFAGMSYGQATLGGCVAAGSFAPVTGNPTLRAEGETELVSDLTATGCTNAGGAANATVTAILSVPVTSRSANTLNSGAASPGNSDAVLTVTPVGAGVPAYYPGNVSGLVVSFGSVALPQTGGAGQPTSFNVTISNVRVNASTGGAPQVTETVLLNYPNAAVPPVSTNVSYTGQNVGYIVASLGYALAANATGATGAPVNSFSTCAGNPLPFVLGGGLTNTFTVNIKQLITGSFKTQAGENGSLLANAGTGVGIGTQTGLPNNTGLSSGPTNVVISLGALPSASTVYVPLTTSSAGETLTLAGNPATATTPSYLVGLNLTGTTTGVVALQPTNGALSIVYNVSTLGTGSGTTFNVPVIVSVAANAAPVQGFSTVSVGYSPTSVITTGTLPSSVPQFAVSTATATNTFQVTTCSTTLLFPYVTNQTGFETGIAIVNTTTDNLKTVPAPGSSATPVTGACTVNFYPGGTATQPPVYTTPVIGVGASTVGSVAANTLSAMSGATNFQGYAIASCPFLEAHGFAYIVDNFGTPSGTAEGYLAVVIPNGRGEAVAPGTTGTLQ